MGIAENGAFASGIVDLKKSSLLEVRASGKVESPLSSPRRPVSPLGDESVRGYATDIKPSYNGAKEIVSVVENIEQLDVPCCIVGEAALMYYGAKRVMQDWVICVSTEHLGYVTNSLKRHSDLYEPFRPNILNVYGNLNAHFPRFKLVGKATFFVVISSQACHLPIESQCIEYDRWIRLPYPNLPLYTQSLLDMWSLTDLEDLVDGMNLTKQWGEENLDLEGHVDHAWACWRETILAERDLMDDELPRWSESKRAIWTKVTSDDAKRKRQGWKLRPDHLTRFWVSGQQDPRNRFKDYS